MTVLRQIELFLKSSGMRPTRFGRIVAHDPRLVFDMRRGRQPGLPMRRRIERYLAEQQA